MSVIKLHTENEKLIFDEKPIITSGNINIDSIDVTLCGKWKEVGENVEIWAVFFRNESERLKVKLNNGVGMIPNEMLIEKGIFYFGIYAENENGKKIKTSKIVEYTVKQGTATKAETESKIVANAQEKSLNDISLALQQATGEPQDGKTWDELKDTVSTLPIVTPEKLEAIDGFELVKISVESYPIGRTGNNSARSQGLFTSSACDINGNGVPFRLPYFNTSRAKWEYVTQTNGKRIDYFSTNLKEVGLDCTSAVNFGNYKLNASIFEYMQKLKLTNVSCPLDGAFKGCKELKTLEIYGVNGVLGATELTRMFYDCNTLIEVFGDEIDLSRGAGEAFKGCYILQYIRFKPFSLKHSIDFGDCKYLHYKPHSYPPEFDCGTLLSILNAIPNPPSEGDNPNADITITFNNALIEYMGATTIVFDADTGLWYYKNPEEITPEDTIVTDINGAFVVGKGVTLAWKN